MMHLPSFTRWSPVLLGGILFLFTVAIYLPGTGSGFIWDDDDYLLDNTNLRTAAGLQRIWLQPRSLPQYYPLVHTTYWLEYRVWGLAPFGYHMTNVLLHATGAVLLWLLLARLGIPGAFLAAAIFAVHPVTTESVVWITERKNVLSGALYFATMLAYFRFSPADLKEPPGERRGWLYALSVGLFVLALLSKTVTASLPAAVLLLIWWKRGHLTRRDLIPLLPMFALGLVAGMHTAYLETAHVGASGADWDLSFLERFLVAGRAVWFYLAKVFWPVSLAFIYPRWEIDTGVWWQYLYPLGTLLLVVAAWLGRHRLGRGTLAAVLFFGGTLFPALGFFDIYPMRYSFVADHFQYLALIAPVVLVAATATTLFKRGSLSALRVPLVVGVVLVLAGLCWRQQLVYRNKETLWRDTLAKNPTAWMAHNNLGLLLSEQGREQEAASHLKDAIRLQPGDPLAFYNLANILARQGDLERAVDEYRKAINRRARYPRAHCNLGIVLARLGRLDEAREAYLTALAIDPTFATAHYNLGNLLQSRGQRVAAAGSYQATLRIDPDHGDAHGNLGVILAWQGHLAEAEVHFQEALRINPGDTDSRANLEQVRQLMSGG